MRRRMLLGWVALALVCGAGCETTRSQIKPPVLPEEVRDPPAHDPRYTQAPQFPKETMKRITPRPDITEAGGPMGPNATMGGGGAGMIRPTGN